MKVSTKFQLGPKNNRKVFHFLLIPFIINCLLAGMILHGKRCFCHGNQSKESLQRLKQLCLSQEICQDEAEASMLNLDRDLAQELLLTNNISIQLAYEQLYSARQRIVAARSMFFPDAEWAAYAAVAAGGGVATVGAVGGILLGVHLFSLPSKWFEYKANKIMAEAEVYAREAVKRNLWGELNQIYLHILRDQLAFAAICKQCQLHEEFIRYLQQGVTLGSTSEAMVVEAKRALIECQSKQKSYEGLLITEMAELKQLLRIDARQAVQLTQENLGPLDLTFMPNASQEELALKAITNSPELMELEELIEVARHMKKKEEWSILTFKGLGFGYTGRVKIAQSAIRQIQAEKHQTLSEIRTQVYATYARLKSHIEFTMLLYHDLQLARRQTEEAKLRYEDQFDSFEAYIKTQLRLVQAQATYEMAVIVSHAIFADLIRQVGYSYNNGYQLTPPSVMPEEDLGLDLDHTSKTLKQTNRRKIKVSIRGPLESLWKVESVTYKANTLAMKTLHFEGDNRFAYTFTTRKQEIYMRVKIRLHNGQIIEKTLTI